MESQKFGHQHPLLFNQSDAAADQYRCSRCGEDMFGPSYYSCVECEFWVHKQCADAPEQIDHPLHPDHSLCLLPTPPAEYKGSFVCNFCGETGEKFFYHCSCDIDLHIKCALFTCKFAENNFGDLKSIACKDPSISTQSDEEEDENINCLACCEPLLDSTCYYSPDHGFRLHKECVELSFQLDYPLHPNHLLFLRLTFEKNPCIVCYDFKRDGLSYGCSLCNFSVHIACLSPPSIIEGNSKQHPFTLISRPMTFTCDACGVEGNSVPYLSSTRNLLLHKVCISVPPIIKFTWHEHLLFHTYFIKRDESSSKSKNWDCVACINEVNTNHGSYYCSECHFILHVNCATDNIEDYTVIESVEEFNKNRVLPTPSYTVIERNEGGEAIKIRHFTHQYNLILSDKILTKDSEFCDGCTLPIQDSFYSCSSKCKFFLHKKCVELPRRKYIWFENCDVALILSAGRVFKCDYCSYVSNGFAYKCPKCYQKCCLRCVMDCTLRCECGGHEHPLSRLYTYEGSCTNCGKNASEAYICKICKVAFCEDCIQLPSKAQHKCDQHLLTLTYRNDNTYSETHFCDICEEGRNPSPWFYSCATCDTCVHPICILQKGKYPFIKVGEIFKGSQHRHRVRFVKQKYYYPKCFKCDAPCRELALECTEPTCDYIVHWECICSDDLKEE